ncbi:hypothetical protein HKK72_01925 [Actinomadura sp. HBU206391]|nr:hypothetical protein [Actinomadura sp. HBU206391]
MRDRFAELGETEPEHAAYSEITENIPQLARFLALRHIWPRLIDNWTDPGALERVPAARRLLAAGADRDDLARVARSAAYDTAFALLYSLSADGRDYEAPEDTPGWVLMETTPEDELTGRMVQALHEDLVTMDPSGRDGADFLFE